MGVKVHVFLYNSLAKFENRIGEQKKKKDWLLLTNCPHEISMYFYTTHQLNLRIGSGNKKEERVVTLKELST